MVVVAARRKSPNQPFNSTDLAQIETVNSPQLNRTTQSRDFAPFRCDRAKVCFQLYRKSIRYDCYFLFSWRLTPLKYKPARRANLVDLEPMFQLPKRPGQNSVGKRSLAFCHPNHSREALEAYWAAFRQGMFVSEAEGQIVSFVCAIQTFCLPVQEPLTWSDATGEGALLRHNSKGEWLYVSRLAYTAGPGHAHLSEEIGPLLTSLQELAVKLNLQGVAFPTRFAGLRDRSGTTEFQRSTIDDYSSLARYGLRPLRIAVYAGFEHKIALPNYLGDGKHFAVLVAQAYVLWRMAEDPGRAGLATLVSWAVACAAIGTAALIESKAKHLS